MLKQEIYLGEYSNVEELEEAIHDYWSGSKSNRYSQCWRRGEHTYDDNYEPKSGDVHPLVAGGAIHSGMAYWYSMGGKQSTISELGERTLEVVRKAVDSRGGFPLVPPDHKYHHLTTGHLEIIFKYYFDWAKIHCSAKPIIVSPDDLDLTDVVGAKWQITPEGLIVLGESAVIMRMAVRVPWSDEPEEYLFAGIPDLPATMGGYDYVMDHKSTGGNLSGWWAGQFRVDNSLRTYCLMERKMLKNRDAPLRGLLINGITTQKSASSIKFKGSRFQRFGPWDFDPGALHEAAVNHASFIRMRNFLYEELGGYHPQVASMSCSNCPYLKMCTQDPAIRPATAFTEYKQRDNKHLLRLD